MSENLRNEEHTRLYTSIAETFNYQSVKDLCEKIQKGGLEYRYMLLHNMYSCYDLLHPINRSLLVLAEKVEIDIALREKEII